MKSLHLRAVRMGVLRCVCNDYTVCVWGGHAQVHMCVSARLGFVRGKLSLVALHFPA